MHLNLSRFGGDRKISNPPDGSNPGRGSVYLAAQQARTILHLFITTLLYRVLQFHVCSLEYANIEPAMENKRAPGRLVNRAGTMKPLLPSGHVPVQNPHHSARLDNLPLTGACVWRVSGLPVLFQSSLWIAPAAGKAKPLK